MQVRQRGGPERAWRLGQACPCWDMLDKGGWSGWSLRRVGHAPVSAAHIRQTEESDTDTVPLAWRAAASPPALETPDALPVCGT